MVEGEGVRVALSPVGGAPVPAAVEDSGLAYRDAYADTDSNHVVTDGRSQEFLISLLLARTVLCQRAMPTP